jgi:hypothetical protein
MPKFIDADFLAIFFELIQAVNDFFECTHLLLDQSVQIFALRLHQRILKQFIVNKCVFFSV